MEKPCLVIMAAGMGSRYGGLKQIDPVDPEGHIVMDFSIYDAGEAGFEKVVFIIKKELEDAFRTAIGFRVEQKMEVSYVYQEPTDLPGSFKVPEERTKPWGTAHALLAARHIIRGPFTAINADDYYGKQAFRDMFRFLTENEDDRQYSYAMSGYALINTLTENGSVSRGICRTDANGYLQDITERTRIEKKDGHPSYSLDDGRTWIQVPDETPVSMNMWGFGKSFLHEAGMRFTAFLRQNLPSNPMKCEYYIPTVVDELLKEGKATVKVMKTNDKWYGITYKEDKPAVQAAIARMKAGGLYPGEF